MPCFIPGICGKLPQLIKAWEVCQHLKGDIAEFGVYNGGTTRWLATASDRTVWAFDTFQGIPTEEFNPECDHDEPGKFTPEAPFTTLFEGWPNIRPVVGRFVDTLPTIPDDVKFAMVLMDCDLYASYKQVLEWLPAHLTPGAIIVVDDYYDCKGAKLAVDEWCAKEGVVWDSANYSIVGNG